MSELYHIKKKKDKGGFETEQPNPFKNNNGNNVSSVGNSLKNIGKKVNNTMDRIESSSGYQIVKASQTAKKDTSSKPVFISNTTSSIKTFGSDVNRKANKFATTAKANKTSETLINDSEEAEKDLLNNPPKKLRKKLNPTKLKEIVGPKRR